MRSNEECRMTFDKLKDLATNSFNTVINLPLFGVNWEEYFAKVFIFI
jgi:hypothetical protein